MNLKNVTKSLAARPYLWGIIITFAIEAVTVFFRFGLGLESTNDTTWLARFTFGLRIHHGYIGVVIVLLYALFRKRSGFFKVIYPVGIGFVLSDVIHHFIVLWLFTGSPQFDLVYPV